MATLVKSFAVNGLDSYVVDIETKTMEGQPMVSIIGMGDQAVKEASERIQSALDETGYVFPKKKIVISLAPGDLRKKGSHFDLAMAISLLQEEGLIGAKDLVKYAFIAELSLNGHLRPAKGIISMVTAARDAGLNSVIISTENKNEAMLVQGIEVLAFHDLNEVTRFLEGKGTVPKNEEEEVNLYLRDETPLDFSDVRGQEDLIDAIVIAAAGGHNLIMIGEPGCGKTMMASRIPSILPKMSEEECLEVTKIYSVTGNLKSKNGMITQRPFRAPHHNASLNSLIGGGANATPGEVSLAHNGVLFLDEIAEFSKRTLDALRQPIEDKKVTIARVNGVNTYPANFMFVTAMNPCPCGYYPSEKCRCTDYEIIKYRGKISGPIMDRIDIQKEVHPVGYFDIEEQRASLSSDVLRDKVEKARKIQQERFKDEPGIYMNSQMTSTLIQKHCVLDEKSKEVLKTACETYGYSARAIHKLLRLARTCADLDGAENIRLEDVRKVLSCRELDQSNSKMLVVKQ